MRKYLVTLVALTFLVFVLGLMAQTMGTSGTSTGASQDPNTTTGNRISPSIGSSDNTWQQSSSSTSQAGSQNPSYGSSGTSSMGSSTAANAKTLEGCVVREETDYFLIPKRGNPVHLTATGSNDLSAHINQHVKVHGNEGQASNMGMGATGTAGTTGAAAGTTTSEKEQETTGSMSSKPGSMGSSTGASSAAGTSSKGQGGTANLHSAATRDIMVDRIDMISETCSPNWNTQWNNPAGANPSKQ